VNLLSLGLTTLIAAGVALPDHWGAISGLLFIAFLAYFGLRERYILAWMGGWIFFLLSRVAISTGPSDHLFLGEVSFVVAIAFFAASALIFTDSSRDIFWVSILAAFGIISAILRPLGHGGDPMLELCFQASFHLIAILAAFRLVRSGSFKPEFGPWLFAIALLCLIPNPHAGGGEFFRLYEFGCQGVLRVSILFLVVEESRARQRRIDLVNAITSSAIGSRDYVGLVQTVLSELRTLVGARQAWFQLVEGPDLVIKQHVGLPSLIADKHSRVLLNTSFIPPLVSDGRARPISAREVAWPLRADLIQSEMNHLLIVPVVGKSSLVGILGFGFPRRRVFTGEYLRFLAGIANQLGLTCENMAMLNQVLTSQQQWVSTIDSITDVILVHDSEPRLLRLNSALARRLGRTKEQIKGLPLAEVLPNAGLDCPYCRIAGTETAEVQDPCFGGYALVSTSTYTDESTGNPGIVHIICDRTERRAADERYRQLCESVQEGVFISTPDGRLIDCNPALPAIFGYSSRAEMLSLDIEAALFMDSSQREQYRAAMEKDGQLCNYELTLRRKDGRAVTLLENSFAIRDQQGRIERYQGFVLDITEKKHAEEDMKRRNRELNALNAMANIATSTFDLDEILRTTLRWTIELFSQDCDIALFDLETGQLAHLESSRCDRDLEQLRALVQDSHYDSPLTSELITEASFASLPQSIQLWISAHGYQSMIAVVMYSQRKTLGVLSISSATPNQFSDTDRSLALAIARQLSNSVEKVLLYVETARAYDNLRNTQEQLLQSEKMSAIGQLISGVAHELNNPLTAILGYAQLLETESISERAQDYVRKLYRQTQRTHRIVQNLLSFSRQRKPIQSQVDLCRVLEDTLSLRSYDLKLNNVTVERDIPSAVPFVTGDAHQIEQVFLNIINNSVDAMMDAAQSGFLRIRIFQEGSKVCVEFRDSGPGLKDSSKIFDPFYTTKKIGKGTGLGLSMCYGIVKEHGGDITAFNHEEKGAVFMVKFPFTAGQKSASV
jgi:two-component system NtrC family sensor kinase